MSAPEWADGVEHAMFRAQPAIVLVQSSGSDGATFVFMVRGSLEAEGFAYYVAELRKSTIDPYAAYRVYERSWNVPAKAAALLRRATIRLIESDPWFLATGVPHFLHSLKTEDLERLTPFVGAGPAGKAAAMLRATLWYHGPLGSDHANRARLRKALSFLEQVPTNQREQAWHEMLVGCYRRLDYAKYSARSRDCCG